MLNHAHRLGALFYLLWGLVQLRAAWAAYRLSADLIILPAEVSGRLYQGAAHMALFGVFAVVVAVRLNWRNSRAGYVSNLAVVSLAEITSIATMLIPGNVPLTQGLPGAVLWLLAVFFSTVGIRRSL